LLASFPVRSVAQRKLRGQDPQTRHEQSARREEMPSAWLRGWLLDRRSSTTMQLPKICLELARGCAGLIGHIQPRRFVACHIA
jgi:hypothetical protein